jgi:hypothetical protein
MEQSERTDLGQFTFTEVKLKYPHDDAKDGAPIDHDVTFFSVDVATRENLYNFLQCFGKRKHCLYEHPVGSSSKKLMRYQELCIDAQNPKVC